MSKLFTIICCATILFACGNVKEKKKNSINKGGEVVGKTATEFMEGVTEGVDKSLQCEIVLSEKLVNSGITTGKHNIEDDGSGGNDNKLELYLIFNDDFNDEIVAKVYNKSGQEMGRTITKAKADSGYAGYFDFFFDKRTDIEVKSKIVLE